MRPATLKDLIVIYGYWEEHPDYSLHDWRYEIENDDTREGYWEWVVSRIEQDCLDG